MDIVGALSPTAGMLTVDRIDVQPTRTHAEDERVLKDISVLGIRK